VSGGSPSTDNLTPSGYPRCGVLDPERADDCAGIDKILVLSPRVSAMVDGSIYTFQSGSAEVWVRNADEQDHRDICVGVLADAPGIQFTYPSPVGVGIVPAGVTAIVVPGDFTVADVEPGTTVRFTFWSTYYGTNCVGGTVSIDALVESYPY
jgi:hypothetical protein